MKVPQGVKDLFNPQKWSNQAFISKSIQERSEHLSPSNYRREGTAFGNDFWLFGDDGHDHYFSFTDGKSSLKAYNHCPPVAAIINRKAQAYINGKTWILNTQGKEATTEPAKRLRKLLLQPNIMQSGKQFEAQAYMYQQLYGYAVVLLVKPFGFPAIDASAMWLIPNWMVEIEETKELFYKDGASIIKRIKINYKGEKTELPLDSVFIMKDFRPSFCSVYLPESRIRSVEMPINNIIGAFESRNVIINKRGPSYVVSNAAKDKIGSIPMTPDEKDEADKAFSMLGLKASQKRAIITSASIEVTPIGFDVAQLKLFEEVVDSAKSICDAFGFPPYLLSLIDVKYDNQKAAEAGLYQNTVIPEAESNYEQWSDLFKLSELNLRLEKDFSHIHVLQEDAKAKADARRILGQELLMEFRANLITYNRVLELLGEDTRPDFNKYYYELLKEGFVFSFGNGGNSPKADQNNEDEEETK